MDKNYLYGLTVQGIQSYIFSTNKLKEIVGASEIIEQLCTTWFYEFLDDKKKEKGIYHLNAAGNIRFQTDKDTAELIFKDFHFFLLEKAPGVPFSQAVVKIKVDNEYQAIQDLDKKLRAQRNIPLYETDLGIMTRSKARRTGGFAVDLKDADNSFADIITSEKIKNKAATALQKKINITEYSYPSEFNQIAEGGKHSWLALIHIDGNGMGNIIKTILENNVEKFKSLKEFSEAVDTCTTNAFKKSIEYLVSIIDSQELKKDNDGKFVLPIRPIILGGDDVTVIIRADLALEFTRVFLENFELKTKESGINNKKGLTACAGIAYVKEKFPFHYSANLAEELCGFAKNKSERKASCIQFHRVQDSIIDNYKEIIERELTADGMAFQNGPYYIDKYKDAEIENFKGVKLLPQTLGKLIEHVKTLQTDNSPKNGIREWVDAKFNNPLMTETLMSRLKKKYGNLSILNNKEAFMDYHTLLAVNTNTEKK